MQTLVRASVPVKGLSSPNRVQRPRPQVRKLEAPAEWKVRASQERVSHVKKAEAKFIPEESGLTISG